MPAHAQDGPQRLSFEPDRFFLSRTRGYGVVRDRRGRFVEGCQIDTQGRWDHATGGMHFDETFTYDDGRTDSLSWSFAPDPQGRMVASEAGLAGAVVGWRDGADYRLRFKRGDPRLIQGLRLT